MPCFPKSSRHIKAAAIGLFTAAGTMFHGLPTASAIDVVELTVKEIEAGFLAGSFTAVDLTQAFLDRIATYDPIYNAFISMNPNALSTAAALDAEYALSGPRSPLHGVPIVIKDNNDFAGMVTTNGYKGFSSLTGGVDMTPTQSASVVERLVDAGAIILGKTNLPDFARDGTRTSSTVSGTTLNPFDITKVPGGSSGGTAVAVNASMAVLGTGTETGTSIHKPASFNALVGVRPSYGLVPIDGIYPLNGTFRDVVGPLARTVYDAAVMLDAVAGPSTRDLSSFASTIPEGGYVAALHADSMNGARIGYFDSAWINRTIELEPEAQVIYDNAISVVESLGGTVVKDFLTDSGWAELWGRPAGGVTSFGHDEFKYLQNLGPASPFNSIEEFNALVSEDLQLPVRDITDPWYDDRNQDRIIKRMELQMLFAKIMDDNDLDALFFPIENGPLNELEGNDRRTSLVAGPVNELGVPGVIVPIGYFEGDLPLGGMFIGRKWDEAGVLSLAYSFEQATNFRFPPTLIPEPSSLALFGIGALFAIRRRVA